MTTQTIRISEPRELLAYLPHSMGFRPKESVVAVSLHPPRGRLGVVVRVDLADLADPQSGPRLARALVGHLDRDGAGSAVLAVYTDRDPRAEPGHPAHAAVTAFREAAELLGDVPAWVVTERGYLSLDCRQDCCPPGGRPMTELDATVIGARMVLAGSVVADRREDVAAIRAAPAEHRRAVGRVATRWAAAGERAAQAGPSCLEAWRLAGVRAWRDEVDRVHADPASARGRATGRLEAALRDVRVRDAVLAALVPGSRQVPEALVRGAQVSQRSTRALSALLDVVLDPTAGRPPQEAALRRHVRVLEQVVAHGRPGCQAPACTLLGFLAWWAGDGARAGVLLQRALTDDAGYRLAQIYAEAVGTGLSPGWVRAQRSDAPGCPGSEPAR